MSSVSFLKKLGVKIDDAPKVCEASRKACVLFWSLVFALLSFRWKLAYQMSLFKFIAKRHKEPSAILKSPLTF